MANTENVGKEIDEAGQVFDALRSGMSYRETARHLGISLGAVQRRVEKYKAEEIHPKAEEMREMQLAQIRAGKRAIWKRYITGDDKAVTSMIRLLEREAKLGGLDSAQLFKVEADVHNRQTDASEVQKIMDQYFGRDSSAEPKVIPHIDVTQRRRRPTQERPTLTYATPHTPADEFAAEPDATATEFAEDPISEDVEELPIHRRRKGRPVQNPAAQFLRDSDDD